MRPRIDKKATGTRIRRLMDKHQISVEDVREYLSLGCVQSIYHWLDGKSLPTLENLYALSVLLHVPVEQMIVGDKLDCLQETTWHVWECMNINTPSHSCILLV